MLNLFRELIAAIENRQPVAVATVIETKRATPGRPGFKLLMRADGTWLGNVGGGEVENRVKQVAREALADGQPRTVHYALREEGPDAIGMLCGGEVTVFVEPYLPKPILLIVGGGHIGRPLAELGRIVGYEVQVVDLRAERADLSQLARDTIVANTYIVLATEDHIADEKALREVVPTAAVYIGLVGSRHKVAKIIERLRTGGFSETQLARVRAPVGLDLGGREPGEIALAVLAEIEAVRHGGSGRPLSMPRAQAAPIERLGHLLTHKTPR
ncbi:MAG: XdhC family protein [Deltaproteobacteria bacterium]|nr:XdhC family protein [Deltaproteobacteria bacterium]